MLVAPDDDTAVRTALESLTREGFVEAELDQIGDMEGVPDDEPHLSAYQGAIEGEVSIVTFERNGLMSRSDRRLARSGRSAKTTRPIPPIGRSPMSATAAIRIGIVGVGKIVRDQHLPALAGERRLPARRHRQPQRQRRRRRRAFKPIRGNARTRSPELDAVSLCMPPQYRYRAAARCA